METKPSMLQRGRDLMQRFCDANGLPVPAVVEASPERWPFGVCAYYRRDVITISVKHCASIGYAGMQWSFPGHSVDRTPYGVIAHELGHHVDLRNATVTRGPYWSDFSMTMRSNSDEAPLTSYCPNDAEWFAEMFRLFVTNPDLLAKLRPRTHTALADRFKPAFDDGWRERLAGAPDRTIVSIERKLEAMNKPARKPSIKKETHASDQHSLL